MRLIQKEIDTLRALAIKYMSYAILPVHREKLALWKALNRSRMQRPMVLIDQLPWNELIPPETTLVVSSDPFWREYEYNLRKDLYKWEHFPVDMVLEPFLTIPSPTYLTGYGIESETEVLHLHSNDTAPSQRFTCVLNEMDDVEKIEDMRIITSPEEEARRMDEAERIFNGTAPIKKSHGVLFHLGLWDKISMWMSVTNVYIELFDRPEFLHAIMERLTQSTLKGIDEANKMGAFDCNANLCHCSHIYTDDLLPDFAAGKGPNTKNGWSYGLAQLFTSVSPDITEEFEIPYITRLAEKFGYIYYGCCDRLDDRMDLVKRIPNVKKVSCSPWSDRKKFAEQIGTELIMSAKPTPAYIAVNTDENVIRKDLQETINEAKEHNVNLELILKDISTVEYKPERITRWADIAMELVNLF